MSEPVSAFPLTWPHGVPRFAKREASRFKTTLHVALENAQGSLRLFGKDSGKPVSGIILSSNVTLGAQRPADPGVAAWFTWEGDQLCIPVDRYLTVEANLQAIHHVIEARRVELRHGTLHLVRATFRGFKALPAPKGWRTWREVFEYDDAIHVGPAMVRDRYKALAMDAHPDRGGSTDRMVELNRARDEALEELK